MNRRLRVRAALTLAASALLLASPAWLPVPAAAQDNSLAQLRLELQSLRYAFDLEIRQLRSEADRLRLRVQELERLRGLPAAPPSLESGAGVRAGLDGELTAHRFVMTDSQGRVRGVLGVSDVHGPALMLLDEQGELMAVFRAEAAERP